MLHNLKLKLNVLALKKLQKPLDLRLEKLDTMEGRQKFQLQMEELGIAHLDVLKCMTQLQGQDILKRILLSQTKCIVRVYMISAFNLSSRDNGSESDPYLIVSCGNKSYNERSNYQQDQPNPDFF